MKNKVNCDLYDVMRGSVKCYAFVVKLHAVAKYCCVCKNRMNAEEIRSLSSRYSS